MGFLFSLYYFIQMKVDWVTILLRALDLITIAVPPALPATMAIGTSFAINRLLKTEIFCTSPPRVNICGKLNIMCFDKTGTLTEEGLDVLGIRFTVSKESSDESPFETPEAHTLLRFSRMYRNVDSVLPKPWVIPLSATASSPVSAEMKSPLVSYFSGVSIMMAKAQGNPNAETDFPYPLIICAMSTCHAIKVVQGELIGDPLDLKMFEFTGWHIDEDIGTPLGVRRASSTGTRLMVCRPPWVPDFESLRSGYYGEGDGEVFTELEVIKSFEFISSLRRMSVISRRHSYAASQTGSESSTYKKEWDVFTKGAPEVMRDICTPESRIVF